MVLITLPLVVLTRRCQPPREEPGCRDGVNGVNGVNGDLVTLGLRSGCRAGSLAGPGDRGIGT